MIRDLDGKPGHNHGEFDYCPGCADEIRAAKAGQALARLEASLDKDLLTDAYSDEEIDALLRAEGGDPGAIARRGERFAKFLRELMGLPRLRGDEKGTP